MVDRSQSRWNDAESRFLRSLSLTEKLSGPDHGDAAGVRHSLGLLYTFMGRYADAERSLRRALNTRDVLLGRNSRLAGSSIKGSPRR